MSAPPDMAVRDAVLRQRERNVLVQASAGTGKTTLMVDRVVHLVEQGMPLERIAVVTFTNPAAAELRMRIREKLRSRAQSPICARALKSMAISWISTIHGFASRILREYFNLTGVDPSFATTEGHFTPAEIRREWERWLLQDSGGSGGELLTETGTAVQKEIALGIEARRWLRQPESVGGSQAAQELLDDFRNTHGKELHHLMMKCTDPSDKLCSLIRAFLSCLAELDRNDVEAVCQLTRALRVNCGSKRNWSDIQSAKDIVRDARKEFGRIAPALVSGNLSDATWAYASKFASRLSRGWDADGSRLSYDDLLYRAWKAVAGSDTLAGLLRDRFDHFLIDEFQDTSVEQTDLFMAILKGSEGIPRGILTVVADDKQSIYGWRNADIETYREFTAEMESRGALCATITTNFRSSRSIIDFVNRFGRRLFDDQTPEEEPFGCEYSPITPRPGAPEGNRVKVLTLPEMPEGMTRYYSAGAYGALVQAGWFASFVERGMARGESPGDFALLYRSGTHVHHFIEALEQAGIPYSSGTSRDFLKRPEISDLRMMIRCLSDPKDQAAWVHTLRSLFFGVPDGDIDGALKQGIRGFMESGEGPEAVIGSCEVLQRLRRGLLSLPLKDFLPELLFQTGMVPVIAATGHQVSRRLGNLQHILSVVLAEKITCPHELMEMLDEELAPATVEEPSSVPLEGGGVAVTTIHRAKGLAWKHVVLAAMPGRRRGEGSRVISYRHRRRAAFSLGIPFPGKDGGTVKTPYWPMIERVERARGMAELRRLLYVAVTRPRDSLVILADPGGASSGSDGSILWTSLSPVLEEGSSPCDVQELQPLDIAPPGKSGEIKPCEDGWKPKPDLPLFSVEPVPLDWQPEGARVGDMVHGIMEMIDFQDPDEWMEVNGEHLRELCGGHMEEVRKLVLDFFSIELPFDLNRCRVEGREYSYIVRTPTGIRKRYIDLLLRKPDGSMVVLDYKTDAVPDDGAMDALVALYRDKQGYYVSDVSRIFGAPTEGYLVFLRAPGDSAVHPVHST